MQLPWFSILIFILFVIGVTISLRARKSSVERKCEHCGSLKIVQISHETLKTRTVNRSGAAGFMPGSDIRLQIEEDVTYRCQMCNQKSTFRITKAP